MNEYQKTVEEFRHHYHQKYNVKLDDEILYFFIRVNEMQLDLKKEIKAIPKLTFKSKWDYFFYGLGRVSAGLLLTAVITSVILIVLHYKW
jgi:hypothetical protein